MKTAMLCSLLVLSTTPVALAQWATQRDPRVPSLPDGKPNLSAPAPKATDGRPDLSGVWLTDGGPVPPGILTVEGDELRVSRRFNNVTAEMKPDQVQMEPWAAELLNKRRESRGLLDPGAYCKPAGEPAQPETSTREARFRSGGCAGSAGTNGECAPGIGRGTAARDVHGVPRRPAENRSEPPNRVTRWPRCIRTC